MQDAVRAVVSLWAVAGLLLGIHTPAALAQSTTDSIWNPFKWLDPTPPRDEPRPPQRATLEHHPTPGPRSGPVESTDLPPVMAPDASGLPLDLWRGLQMADIERLLTELDPPPRSPALHQLWTRMLLSSAAPPAGGTSPDHFLALRLEALYRSGLLTDMTTAAGTGSRSTGPAQVLLARKDVGLGLRDAGCAAVKSLAALGPTLSARLRGEVQLLVGYCAAVAGDTAAAGLAASLAREEGIADDVALRVLDSVSMGVKPELPRPPRVSLLDYRFLKLLGPAGEAQIVEKAEPALLVVLAGAPTADLRMRTAAAEAALRMNAMTPEAVADIYRLQPEPSARSPTTPVDPMLRRAQLFRAVEATQAPDLKGRLLRALLEDARRAGIHIQTARMLAPLVAQLWPSSETGTLAEPVVEVAVSAGEYELARRWAETAASLQHWLTLIDLARPQPGEGRLSAVAYVDQLAARGRLSGDAVHRLATVLDALDMAVPMGIWEAAGRIPQPAAGYLPDTGVLAELAQAAQRKETGRTALMAMRALGPNGAEGANILALGDAVRALKRAGLESDARRLAFEALLAVWPRTLGH